MLRSSLALRQSAIIRSVMSLLALFAAFFLSLAPARSQPVGCGQWKIEAQYAGDGTNVIAGNGDVHETISSINGLQFPSGAISLTQVPNTPASTLTGGITARLKCRAFGHAINGGASVTQTAPASQVRFVLTWQPKNGDAVADPPPPRVRFYYRRKVNLELQFHALQSGVRCTVQASLQCDPYQQSETIQTHDPPESYGFITPYSQDPAPLYAELSVSPQGVATHTVPFSHTVSAQVDAPYGEGGGGGRMARTGEQSLIGPDIPIPPVPLSREGDAEAYANLWVDYFVEGVTAGRVAPMGGGQQSAATDPSFTRWLPLSFSPVMSSQPYRFQSGALPAPWGNMYCYYSMILREEANPDLPNFDAFGLALRYLVQPVVSILDQHPDYNNPQGPYQTTGNTKGFVPRYSLTDASGDRLLWNALWTPHTDVRSTLVSVQGGFQLVNAGPPGAIRQKGRFTYTFQTISTNPLIARLTAIADDRGNTQTLNWTGGLTVTDSSTGRQLVFTGSPCFTRVDAPAYGGQPGIYTTLSWDGAGHLTALRVYPQSGGAPIRTTTWTYGGPNGDSILSETQGGAVAAFTYVPDAFGPDPFGLPIPRLATAAYGNAGDTSSSDDGGSVQGVWTHTVGTTQKGYSFWGIESRTNTTTDPRGNVSSLTYEHTLSDGLFFNAINGLTAKGPDFTGAPANSNVWKVGYTPDITHPTQVTLTDPFSRLWPTTFDADGNVTQTTDPLGHSWLFGYTPDGLNLASITDPTGPVWQFGYTGTRLTSVTDPAGATRLTATYNAFGQPTSVTVPAAVAASGQNEVTQFAYDAVTGDLTSATDPLGNVLIVNAYDALGDPLSASLFPDTGDPQTSQTPLTSSIVWDAAQQMIQALLPNGVQIVNTWTNGLVTQTQAQAPGGATLSQMSFSYDSRGRLYAASDLVGSCAQYRYDRSSNLTKVLDGRGNTTRVTYGPNDEPTSLTWPGGQSASALYDAVGRLASTTDERGTYLSYGYDNADRLTAVGDVTITYDSADRPLTLTAPNKSATFSYDPTTKRLTGLTTITNGFSYTVSYTYYPDGKRATMTSPFGTTTYAYDATGNVTSLTDPLNQTTTWTYDHTGRPLSQTSVTRRGVNISTVYGYGPSGQPGDPSTTPSYLRTITQTVNGQTVRQYTLTHSYLGQLLQRSGVGPNGYAETATFGYDARGRLTSEADTVIENGQPHTASGTYQYDLSDNLQGGINGWTYNSNNQVTNAPPMGGLPGATGLSYDASGNMTSLNGLTLTYDLWGQMTSAGSATYTYDIFGRRATKTVGGQTTCFLYDGDDLIGETDGSGNPLHGYLWGPFGLLSDVLFDLLDTLSRFCLPDDADDVRAVVDEYGSVTEAQVFTAYSERFWASQPVPSLPVSRGGYQDNETGLVYGGGSAYYAPCIGRFTTPSAPGYADNSNPYAYEPPVEEPPDAWVMPDDPSGRQFYYDGFRRTVNRGARIAESVLNTAAYFNPICQAIMVWKGQDAAGHKLSAGERVFILATMAVGPAVRGLGTLRLPKINLLPGFASRLHHVFPQAEEFAQQWRRLQIDIDRYAVRVNRFFHSRVLHAADGNPGGWWNTQWRNFFARNPEATSGDVFRFMEQLREQKGIGDLPFTFYNRWPWLPHFWPW
jgi:YD repeat-containing protein